MRLGRDLYGVPVVVGPTLDDREECAVQVLLNTGAQILEDKNAWYEWVYWPEVEPNRVVPPYDIPTLLGDVVDRPPAAQYENRVTGLEGRQFQSVEKWQAGCPSQLKGQRVLLPHIVRMIEA